MKTHTVIDGNAFYEIDEKCYEELMKMKKDEEKIILNQEYQESGYVPDLKDFKLEI